MFQIVLVQGAVPQEFTRARAERYQDSVVSEVTEDGDFVRVIAKSEWSEWGDTAPKPIGKELKKPVLKEAVSEKKPATKKKTKKVNKQSAIPDEEVSLENIDVSSL